MAQAREHSAVMFMRAARMVLAGTGGPDVLLRVPGAARSSLTYAKRPGHPSLVLGAPWLGNLCISPNPSLQVEIPGAQNGRNGGNLCMGPNPSFRAQRSNPLLLTHQALMDRHVYARCAYGARRHGRPGRFAPCPPRCALLLDLRKTPGPPEPGAGCALVREPLHKSKPVIASRNSWCAAALLAMAALCRPFLGFSSLMDRQA